MILQAKAFFDILNFTEKKGATWEKCINFATIKIILKKITAMAKYTKEEYALAKKQSDELFALILKKTGTSRSKLYELAKHEFVAANLDIVTSDERKQFDRLVFGL